MAIFIDNVWSLEFKKPRGDHHKDNLRRLVESRFGCRCRSWQAKCNANCKRSRIPLKTWKSTWRMLGWTYLQNVVAQLSKLSLTQEQLLRLTLQSKSNGVPADRGQRASEHEGKGMFSASYSWNSKDRPEPFQLYLMVFIWDFYHQKSPEDVENEIVGLDDHYHSHMARVRAKFDLLVGAEVPSQWTFLLHRFGAPRDRSPSPKLPSFPGCGTAWLKVQCMESSCCGIFCDIVGFFCDMTICCGRGIVGVNLNLSHFSHDVSRSCFKKVCCEHASPGSWISPRPQGCGYWNGQWVRWGVQFSG